MRKRILAAMLAAMAFTGGYLAHPSRTVTVVRTTDNVTSFNDGWNTALHGDGK